MSVTHSRSLALFWLIQAVTLIVHASSVRADHEDQLVITLEGSGADPRKLVDQDSGETIFDIDFNFDVALTITTPIPQENAEGVFVISSGVTDGMIKINGQAKHFRSIGDRVLDLTKEIHIDKVPLQVNATFDKSTGVLQTMTIENPIPLLFLGTAVYRIQFDASSPQDGLMLSLRIARDWKLPDSLEVYSVPNASAVLDGAASKFTAVVVDDANGFPLPGVKVNARTERNRFAELVTDNQGRFTIGEDILPGPMEVVLSHECYESERVAKQMPAFSHVETTFRLTRKSDCPPSILKHPISLTVLEGEKAEMSVNATGEQPLKYEWRHEGTAIEDQPDGPVLTIDEMTAMDEGSYEVEVSNDHGKAVSDPASLTLATLGIDRWWAKAGGNAFDVTWTLRIEKADDYLLTIEMPKHWNLAAGGTTAVIDDSTAVPVAPDMFGTVQARLGKLERGVHQIRISKFQPPEDPVVEQLLFRLTSRLDDPQPLTALFVADNPRISASKRFVIRGEDGASFEATGPIELSSTFLPTLCFASGEQYPFAFSVNSTWQPEAQRRNGDSNADFDLSAFDVAEPINPNNGFSPTIYASAVEQGDTGHVAINYWFHYPRSNWRDVRPPYQGPNTHEGDWEGVTVFLEKRAGMLEPTEVAFAQHVPSPLSTGGARVPWANVESGGEGFSFHVYVGLGGHASYSQSAVTDWTTGAELHYAVPPCTGAHALGFLHPVGEVPENVNDSTPEWLRYSGHWGGGGGTPRGPVFLGGGVIFEFAPGTRWLNPWAWAADFGSPLPTRRPFEMWLALHFPNNDDKLNLTRDSDGDGLQDLLEYALGRDPTRVEQESILDVQVESANGGESHVCYRFERSKTAFGVDSELQVSEDLSNWRTLPNQELMTVGETEETWIVEARMLPKTSSNYVRLSAVVDSN